MSAVSNDARRVLGLIDLTDLSDDCTPGAIDDLCRRAITPFGSVPAVCVWPEFVTQARDRLGSSGVLVATVVNFPTGDSDVVTVVDQTAQAIVAGADEIDVVIPYRRLLDGDHLVVTTMVAAVKDAAAGRHVKAILETGQLPDQQMIATAARLAIAAGADFVKTSTGKTAISATLPAARTMLEVIREQDRPIGLKPSGGIRTVDAALPYLALADELMGSSWVSSETFRLGASGLLDDVLILLDRSADR